MEYYIAGVWFQGGEGNERVIKIVLFATVSFLFALSFQLTTRWCHLSPNKRWHERLHVLCYHPLTIISTDHRSQRIQVIDQLKSFYTNYKDTTDAWETSRVLLKNPANTKRSVAHLIALRLTLYTVQYMTLYNFNKSLHWAAGAEQEATYLVQHQSYCFPFTTHPQTYLNKKRPVIRLLA